tara:strand:+ start:92 stop:352 length:261 start_codon:yes stop_codon:yes gene_type:complete
MTKLVIIIVMFFPNLQDYDRGNVLIVSHKDDKELVFEKQEQCYEYVTNNISELIQFAKNSYKEIKGAQVSQFLCLPKDYNERGIST